MMITESSLITLSYLVLFTLLVLVMKTTSLFMRAGNSNKLSFIFFSPVPSVRTWLREANEIPEQKLVDIRNFNLTLFALVGFYLLPDDTLSLHQVHWFWQGYIAIVPFWLLTEHLGRMIRIVYSLFSKSIPHIHDRFWTSKTLMEFWDSWNVWFADWFKQVCFKPFIGRPFTGLFVLFTTSALIHEYLVNLPFYWFYDDFLFGSFFLYFYIQYIGILVQKYVLENHRILSFVSTWLVVLIPGPLVLNEATLRVFHLGFFD